MSKEKKKKHKIKSPAVLSRIVILLFLMMLMTFVNISSITHFLNRTSYDTVTAHVLQPTTDDFLMLIPRVEITYQYQGQTYNEKEYFVLEPLFGLSSEKGTELPLYVNIYAPTHSIFKVNFFRNIVNWILLILEAACIYNLVFRIRRYRSEKRAAKEGLKL